MTGKVVIIGAGQAGGVCAKTLRDQGFDGAITLLGSEGEAPYERPPLSKAVLAGTADAESCRLFPAEIFAGLNLNFHADDPAMRIDRQARRVTLGSGRDVDYDTLVLATGGTARALPGMTGESFHTLRNLNDVTRLKSVLDDAKALTVVGGGWIGLEVASTVRGLGVHVVLLEAGARLSGRAAPARLSDYLLDLHRRHGVEIRLSTTAEPFQDGALRTSDGEVISADAVLVAVGLQPNTELAEAAGLPVDNGILVDGNWRTEDPAIFAIGDCARRNGERLESWANAQASGDAVGRILCGQEAPADPVPWFWSDQFGVNMQILGQPDSSATLVVRGEQEDDSMSLFYLDGERLVGMVTIGRPRDMAVGRRLMEREIAVRRADLMDEDKPLRDLLK